MKLIKLDEVKKTIYKIATKEKITILKTFSPDTTIVTDHDEDETPYIVYIHLLLDEKKMFLKKDEYMITLSFAARDILSLKDNWYSKNINSLDDYKRYLLLYMELYPYQGKNTFYVLKNLFNTTNRKIETIGYKAFIKALNTIIKRNLCKTSALSRPIKGA